MNAIKIVIADNESIIRMDLRELLEESGHEIIGEAVDGLRAVELTRKYRPDLVIMDIKMPEMNGYQATSIIKQMKPSIPIIAQTAYAMAEDIIKGKNAGCDDYLSKPIRVKELQEKLHAIGGNL